MLFGLADKFVVFEVGGAQGLPSPVFLGAASKHKLPPKPPLSFLDFASQPRGLAYGARYVRGWAGCFESFFESRVDGFNSLINFGRRAVGVREVVVEDGRIRENIVEFFPISVFGKADAFGFLFGTRGDVKHDVAVVRIGVKGTDVPITNQIHATVIGNSEIDNRVVASTVEKSWGCTLVGPG